MKQRVVITGMGVICSAGASVDEFDTSLRANCSGIKDVTLFDTSQFAYRSMGEIAGVVSRYEGLDRASELALRAAESAVDDAGAEEVERFRTRTGVALGTTCGGVTSHELHVRRQRAAKDVAPECLDEVPFHAMSGHIARRFRLGGPVATITIACASGSNAIGYASDLVRNGKAEIMLAGGSDCVSAFTFSGFTSLRAMTRDACRPFDKGRTGIALGEGAAVVVLEAADRAIRRGARIHAEILGHGFCNDAYHSTSPDPSGRGMLKTVHDALASAGIGPDQVDYINAHGTGTTANDDMELAAYGALLGDRSARVPVTSQKAMIGHTLGAAGAIELVATVLALKGQYVPATLNSCNPPDESRFDIVPNKSRGARLKYALCCNAGFAGHNAAVLLGRFDAQPGNDASETARH
jgi:3-oxoacyl-[acyl-carrier-protein] synthase II